MYIICSPSHRELDVAVVFIDISLKDFGYGAKNTFESRK